MTPISLARNIVSSLSIDPSSRVLEPSFGTGSFLIPIIEQLLGNDDSRENFHRVMSEQVYGIEIDAELYAETVASIENRWYELPAKHHLLCNDFFLEDFPLTDFDFIIGNPPFGGSFNPSIEDSLDRKYGRWNGHKLKKETYSFFVAKSLELLNHGGVLAFIVSDTFLTISTMAGLRHRLADQCAVEINSLDFFSEETKQPMVLLKAIMGDTAKHIVVNGERRSRSMLERVGRFSWGVSSRLAVLFEGDVLGDYLTCTSGMTIGKNELFLRPIVDGVIVEPYEFSYYQEPITLERELERARLGKLSPAKIERVRAQEERGETRRNVRIERRRTLRRVELPHPDYAYYNRAVGREFYAPPSTAIYWKDDGDAVLTFKRNGNWYLHGVGGAKYFGREGITWQLIGNKIRMRYLPEGFVLDSGAPCGFLKEGVNTDELWFILGWTNSSLATTLMKEAINHTRNIQSKDIERLPYPWWVSESDKSDVISMVRRTVTALMSGGEQPSELATMLEDVFSYPSHTVKLVA